MKRWIHASIDTANLEQYTGPYAIHEILDAVDDDTHVVIRDDYGTFVEDSAAAIKNMERDNVTYGTYVTDSEGTEFEISHVTNCDVKYVNVYPEENAVYIDIDAEELRYNQGREGAMSWY